MDVLPVYIGFDRREIIAYDVLKYSIEKHSTIPVVAKPLNEVILRHMGIYGRNYEEISGQKYDLLDKKPFSTDFAFSRFLVPALTLYEGWAIFCDCDMLFRADIKELFELRDDKYAVMVCKHDYDPLEREKMDGQVQTRYNFKNWSSMMLWNCEHPKNTLLTPNRVNSETGIWLHQFSWLDPDDIGSLPLEWNWLEGSADPKLDPKVVHYTRGGPWFTEWQNVDYADDWNNARSEMVRGSERNLRAV